MTFDKTGYQRDYMRKRRAGKPSEKRAMREVITEANNSLFGTHGFFLSLDGGEPDKHHLSRAIEALKYSGNNRYREGERLREALEQIATKLEGGPSELAGQLRAIVTEALR